MSDYSPTQQQQNYSQSTAFAEALQRAKQIAAKIQPGNQPQGGQKRPSDDSFEGNKQKKFSGGETYNANSPPLNNAAAAAAAQQAQALAARLGQNNTNKNNQNNNGGPSPPQEAVQRARELINKMVGQGGPGQMGQMNNHGGNGGPPTNNRPGLGSNNYHNPNSHMQELMVAGPKVGLLIGKGGETIKQLQERAGVKMVIIQEGPGMEQEKPLRITGDFEKVERAKQMVLEFLADLDAKQGGGGGGGGRMDRNDNDHNDRQNDFRGHGGGGRGGYGGGGRGGPGGGGGGGGYNNHGGGNPMHHQQNNQDGFEMLVPKAAVGVVIGKGGEMIKRIAKESGCKLQFIEGSEPNGDRRCMLQGMRPCVESGKRMIDELIDGAMKRHGMKGPDDSASYANYQGPMVTREEYTFTIPASKCGIVIGRGGDTIKQINQQSGAHCEMDRKASANQTVEKTFTIKGEQHQIDEAKRLIQDKINIEINMTHVGSNQVPATQNTYNANTANPYAQWMGWDASQAAAAATQQAQPQADYSQQWIDYYKQMGMHREADMIEQQLKMRPQGQPVAPAAPAAQANGQAAATAAAAGGQPADYSAQWAEYYRRIGKVDEAEAIEKQIAAAKAVQGAQPAPPSAPAPQAAAANSPYGANPQMAAYGQYQQYYGAQAGYAGYPYGYPGAPQPGVPQPGQPAPPQQAQPPAPAPSDK